MSDTEAKAKRPQRKRARASTGNEVLKKTYEGQEDVKPLAGDDLPADDTAPGIPIRRGDSGASGGSEGVNAQSRPSDPEKPAQMAPMAPQRASQAARPAGDYKTSTNYFIPASKIRDWQYNDRTQEAILADPKFPELKESIELSGRLAEAIVVRPLAKTGDDGCEFEQVIGCKRLTACKLIDPNFLVESSIQELTDAEAAALQAAENKGRSDPPIWDRGLAWAKLLEKGVYSSVRELTAALGEKHEKTVANYVRFARNIASEPEFRTLPLSFLAQNPLDILSGIAKGKDFEPGDREELVQRIVEIEDDIRKRPERATKLIENAIAAFKAEKSGKADAESKEAKPKVYQSEHGKTLTLSSKNNELKLTLHSDISSEIDHTEVEDMILKYLEGKGLHVKEKGSRK